MINLKRGKETKGETTQKPTTPGANKTSMSNLFGSRGANKAQGGFVVEKERKPVSHTISSLKVYSLILTSTFVGALASYLLVNKSVGYGLLAILVFIMIFIVQSVSLRRNVDILLASVANSFGLSLFLYTDSIEFTLSSFVVLLTLFALAHIKGRREVANMVKIRFFKAVRSSTSILLLALAVFAGFALFANGKTFLESKNIGRAVEVVGRPVFGNSIEGFSADMSAEDFLRGYVKNQIDKDSTFDNASAFQRDLAVRTAAVSTSQYIESVTQHKLVLKDSLADNVQSLIASKSENLTDKSRPIRLLLLIFVLVLAVKSIEFILHVPLVFLAFLLYELLSALNFLVVQFESRSKEVLSLS